MYLGGGIIRYNADKAGRQIKDLKSQFERRNTSIVDVVIEMSSVALQ